MTVNLLDNDVVLKISQYDLVNEFIHSNADSDLHLILPTLKYSLCLDHPEKALRIVKSEYALATLLRFVADLAVVNYPPKTEVLNHFVEVDQIDPGEALLFALSASFQDHITITGDKRALKAVASVANRLGLQPILSGKLICLEQLVAKLLLSERQEEVILKISNSSWDTALHNCFRTNNVETILNGLKSYYNHLNIECEYMLQPFPRS